MLRQLAFFRRIAMCKIKRADLLYSFVFFCNVTFLYQICVTGNYSVAQSERNHGQEEVRITTHLTTAEVRHVTTKPQNYSHVKRILIFNTMWGFRLPYGREAFEKCPQENACEVVQNGRGVNASHFDAVLFHRPTMKEKPPPLVRLPHQRFVFFSMEPAVHMPTLKQFDNFFNWTMGFRTDSDFHLPFGKLTKTKEHTEETRTDYAQNKTKLIAWFVSNCKTTGKREDYIKKLQKYVQVDIFGKCGNSSIPPRGNKEKDNETYTKMAQEYKFYLSFENSMCEDYISEKLFNVMRYNVIPVVYGGGNYSQVLPKYSYINAADYTPRKLATYLLHLSKKNDEYNAYFWWKPYYQVFTLEDTNIEAFCELCTSLHRNTTRTTKYGIGAWWFKQKKCVWNYKFKDDN